MCSAGVGIDFDNFSAGIKGASIKCHDRRAVRPDGVIEARSVERRILEHRGLIAPVERLTIKNTVFEHGIVDANEAKVVHIGRKHLHVLEGNGARSVKRIVTVVLGTVVLRIGNLGTNAPRCLIGTGTHERKILVLGVALGAHLVERIVTLGEQDGLTAFGISGSGGKILVGLARLLIGNLGDSRSVGICRRNKGAQRKCQRTCHYGDGADPPPRISCFISNHSNHSFAC